MGRLRGYIFSFDELCLALPVILMDFVVWPWPPLLNTKGAPSCVVPKKENHPYGDIRPQLMSLYRSLILQLV